LTLRVGLVGCGRWGANVLRDLVALGADVTVAEPDTDRRDRALATGAARGVATAGQLPTCDGYVVVTPAPAHRDVCEYLLSRAAPVFVEKPPCTDVADVEELARIGRDRLFVMHKWRYHPGIRVLAELARSGKLGTPERLETIRTGPEVLPPDVDVLWHLGTHDLSIALEILDGVAPVRAADATRDAAGRITQCRATMGSVGGPEHWMTVAAAVPERVRRVVVAGTEASAVLDHPEATAVSVRGRDRTEHVPVAQTMPLAEELRVFLAHLAGGPPPVSDVTTALVIAQRLSELQRAADSAPA
jgi:predicted dehydrogenase